MELDEEPPHNINKKALKVSLKISKMLNSNIIKNIQFMRKLIVDGSIVSGFQRTALIGIGGHILVNNKKIGINYINLEEDSSKIIDSEKKIFSLSRQGTPLIEISTAPHIKTPNEAKEVAYFLGNILNSFKEIKRGIGTIRQDLNVSIKNGAKVELKGVQNLKEIPNIIENEVERQKNLLNLIEKVKKEIQK